MAELVVPFLDHNLRYAYGVEFGMAYMVLRELPDEWSDYICTANEDQFLVLASRLGYEVVKREQWKDGPEWTYLELRRR